MVFATAAFKQSNDHFRKSLLESEEKIFKFKDQVQSLEDELGKIRKNKNDLEEELQLTKDDLSRKGEVEGWTWQEQEKNIEKITTMEEELKVSEDEVFKLKRANQKIC